ncbi:nuclear transport factor 2 family protein [Paractinoplanes lichenicola]|uniref:Nuclear transport factor 2 family protein n=1 Tax=Paractinoplanes lichenicola TaxID=2802976 RepID=A0ABS1VU99_9ACTN|nr:nuclear transport factor 2 family protein [Actinoplanes lichenicola]MBL7258025.1 nuclear transport factor 2 family protein [Actinoplanes lichenicola]
MATNEELMRANLLEVFNERDAGRRRAAIARIYAPDVQFNEPDEPVVGHAALDAKAQGILDGAPGFVFTPDGPAQANQDLGYLAWNLGPEGQAPVVRGRDIALIADGRIVKVYTLLQP